MWALWMVNSETRKGISTGVNLTSRYIQLHDGAGSRAACTSLAKLYRENCISVLAIHWTQIRSCLIKKRLILLLQNINLQHYHKPCQNIAYHLSVHASWALYFSTIVWWRACISENYLLMIITAFLLSVPCRIG
jgi:hypothetical protein